MVRAVLVVTLLSFLLPAAAWADPRDKERWDLKYGKEEYLFGKEPIPFLTQHVNLLPKGKVLDVAMGEGRNGVFLATQGFQVIGVDISEIGLTKARKLAADKGVTVETRVQDLDRYEPERNVYDVVLCTYYLQRDLFPRLKDAVKPGGMIVVETYSMDHVRYKPEFPKEYLLRTNELLEIFKDFTILRYQVVDDGTAVFSSIIAQKP